MKPIIIKVEEKQGKIELTEKELQEYVEQAYNQGWADGYESGKSFTYPVSPWNPSPSIPQTPVYPYTPFVYCESTDKVTLNSNSTATTSSISKDETQAVISADAIKKSTKKKK